MNEGELGGTPFSLKPQRGASQSNVPDISPLEQYEHVNEQLYGTQENPNEGAPAPMNGFVKNFARAMGAHGKGIPLEEQKKRMPQVMETYTPAQLPMLSGLARHYAVSDLWFASVPTQTNVNRAFLLMGTSNGSVNNAFFSPSYIPDIFAFDVFQGRTIFHVLEDNWKDWTVFWHDEFPPGFSGGKCFTRNAYAALDDISNVEAHFRTMKEFHRAARLGHLPAFSYVEVSWGFGLSDDDPKLQAVAMPIGNDFHPPRNMKLGENLIRSVYESLTANEESWNKTLFILTFDEHVGSFDHVSPPWGATPPWGEGTPPETLQKDFKFDRFGARIPTILISPHISRGTVFRAEGDVPYDHTSIAATFLNRHNIEKSKWGLGERMAKAPTFENQIDLAEPRTDLFAHRRVQDGEELRSFDQFHLKNVRTGDYLVASPPEWTLLRQNYRYRTSNKPYAGNNGKAPFSFLTGAEEKPIVNGGTVQIGAHQDCLDEKFVITASPQESRCVYKEQRYKDCINPKLPSGEPCAYNERRYKEAELQEWHIRRTGSNAEENTPIRCGEVVSFTNAQDGGLFQVGEFLNSTPEGQADSWKIEAMPTPSQSGKEVAAGQLVYLKCVTSGEYISVVYRGYRFYPSVSNVGPVALRALGNGGTDIQLQTDEAAVSGKNLLGAWTTDKWLYYYSRDDEEKQSWTIERIDSNNTGPVIMGEHIYLVNKSWEQNLAIDGEYLTTEPERRTIWCFEEPQ